MKVLIVEDDQFAGAALAKLLSGKGYRIRQETNGAAALLAAHEEVPNVILMSLAVPILEGMELLHALRHDPRTAHIPVIALAARNDEKTLASALVAGANILLVKPPDAQELLSTMERLVTFHPKQATA